MRRIFSLAPGGRGWPEGPGEGAFRGQATTGKQKNPLGGETPPLPRVCGGESLAPPLLQGEREEKRTCGANAKERVLQFPLLCVDRARGGRLESMNHRMSKA